MGLVQRLPGHGRHGRHLGHGRRRRPRSPPALTSTCIRAGAWAKLRPLMAVDTSSQRAVALRVAKWLIEKNRPDEGVALLAAWAANGPNDSEGQELLAEALRVDPSARVSQMAFERMEGVPGEHAELDAVIARYAPPELAKLEAEMKRPSFRRAQMGFNNNIKFQAQVFHVQTEDSGLNAPHIITHLFADGGRVIKSHKRIYAAAIDTEPDIGAYVRQLMKAQHLEMVFQLRDGKFDDVLAGKAIGGLEV